MTPDEPRGGNGNNRTLSRHEAIVVGAGDNGLVAACYLARVSLGVVVLERNSGI